MVKSLCIQYSPPLLSIPPAKSIIATGLLTPSDSNDDSCSPLVSGLGTPEPELESYHPFPPPSRLSAPDVVATLRSLGFGYRADFIQKTAKMLVDVHGVSTTKRQEGPEKWLETLRSMSTADAREELLKLMGVGRKVADCILLMSLDKVRKKKNALLSYGPNCLVCRLRSFLSTRTFSRLQRNITGSAAVSLGLSRRCLPSCTRR